MARLPEAYVEGWAEENAIFRTARKTYRCQGSGVRHAPDCKSPILPGDPYIEYVGETPAYQRGPAVCMPCALAFDYVRRAETGDR